MAYDITILISNRFTTYIAVMFIKLNTDKIPTMPQE